MKNSYVIPAAPLFSESLLASRYSTSKRAGFLLVLVIIGALTYTLLGRSSSFSDPERSTHIPVHAGAILAKCHSLTVLPGPDQSFHLRQVSDRFSPGTPPTLIRNATIWTGLGEAENIVKGDILLDGGIIQAVGSVPKDLISKSENLVSFDAHGAWVTTG
jgi:hypothetical protein